MGERMRVLVAYDGSDCADAALADLRERFLLGSNSAALVKNAPCTVEVVRG